ncbi:hypothetical protein [Kribbella catacumbae]|uniref:hypothetical protein n=1 Tax=Kribbella catacumbae TaxID=460086 RepID=UPI0003788579|nr:hypothetical protein [Kribbella catacumbae]
MPLFDDAPANRRQYVKAEGPPACVLDDDARSLEAVQYRGWIGAEALADSYE